MRLWRKKTKLTRAEANALLDAILRGKAWWADAVANLTPKQVTELEALAYRYREANQLVNESIAKYKAGELTHFGLWDNLGPVAQVNNELSKKIRSWTEPLKSTSKRG